MTFNTPNVDDILSTLIGNNALVNALKNNGALITKEQLLNEYHLSVMKQAAMEASIRNVEAMRDLAELILENEEHIRKESIWQLTAEEFLFPEIRIIFGLEKANDELYQSIFYCYKYCYVSSFFQNNAEKFIPQCDIDEIRENPAAEAFLDAMLKEFDKINRLLEETKDYLDYDKIPWNYIVYLTQLLGLEKDLLDVDDSEEAYYRELAKNILDIYRIKGTTYSYELFFNFIGIDIEIKEFFFDRRYFFAKYPQENTYTNTSDKYSKDFYLTTVNPSYNLNPDFSTSETVTLGDFSNQENLKDFKDLAEEYGLEAVLGYSKYDKNGNEYKERVYKYFKTNYIYYYASAMGGRSNLTSKQINSLAKYLDFLTPIFVMRDIKTVAYTMNDDDFIAFDGDNGDRKYGAFIDGTYEGFQMLDGECWESVNKDLYTTVSDDGENKVIYYAKNGEQIEYRNSLPDWNDVDTKTFRQPLEFGAMSIYTSRYLGYERNSEIKDGEQTSPSILKGRRLKYYSYDDENGTVYRYTTHEKPNTAIDVTKMPLVIEEPIYPKISSLNGKDSVRKEIEKNNYYKKIKYVINSKGEDVNELLNKSTSINSNNDENAIMSELSKCAWKEHLLPYSIKLVKTAMYEQKVGGATVGSTTIKYPTEFETDVDRILNSFNIVLFTADNKISNPKTEGEKYLNSIYVKPSEIKRHLVVGDYFIKQENGKYNVYRCFYDNKKVWYLTKLFPDVKDGDVIIKNQNNRIQLSGNFRTERSVTNALKNFFPICMRGEVKIDRYSHLYKINEGSGGGYYYAPAQVYTEIFGEDISKPNGLVAIPKLSENVPNPNGWYEGDKQYIGKTFFEGNSISYDNPTELDISNNRRYICFWDRQVGDLIIDEFDGKLYEVCNYGPRGLVEIKFNGSIKKCNFDENGELTENNGKDGYALFEHDDFWKGYDEEGDADDFIGYNNEHIINWFNLGIYGYKWHRPIKFFTDKLYDSSLNDEEVSPTDIYYRYRDEETGEVKKNVEIKNDYENFDTACPISKYSLFESRYDTRGYSTFKKLLLKDIWDKTFESFSEDLKNNFIRAIIDVSKPRDDNPETYPKPIEGYNTEELFTRFYGLIIRDVETITEADASYEALIEMLKSSISGEEYELNSTNSDTVGDFYNLLGIEVDRKTGKLIDIGFGDWRGFNNRKFDEYYNYKTNSWETRDTVVRALENDTSGLVYTNYRVIDINNNICAKARYQFSEEAIFDDYNEYTSPIYLMYELLKSCKESEEKEDAFLKNYFYEELLKRYREAFLSDENGMKIDSKDYGLFQGLPLTIEKWNGKGGKFAAPRALNSQFLNEGSDNFSSTKIPLKSVTFRKNNSIKIPFELKKVVGNHTIVTLNKKPSTDIIFEISFSDWYYNSREIFGVNNVRDFNGRLIYGESADEAIAELRENYIKCFSPIITIPKGNDYFKYFKKEIEKDYSNNYNYNIYYKNGNNKTPITSIEQGVVSIYYNGSWVDWESETDNNKKKNFLKNVFNNSIIEIIINDTSKNTYLTKKRFEETDIDKNIEALSDCFNKEEFSINRDTGNSAGYISLKYLKHKFKDNYISVPNSLDWIKIKNGKRNEYTSYIDDREVASKSINTSLLEEGKFSNSRIENKIAAKSSGGGRAVIDIESGNIIEDTTITFLNSKDKKISRNVKSIKKDGVDITNKSKLIDNNKDIFASRLIDEKGNIKLKIKNLSLSDIKEVVFTFRLLFVKLVTRILNVSIKPSSKYIWARRKIQNLHTTINETIICNINISRVVNIINSVFVKLVASKEYLYKAIHFVGNAINAKKQIDYRFTWVRRKVRNIDFSFRHAIEAIFFCGRRFFIGNINVLLYPITNKRWVGRSFIGNIITKLSQIIVKTVCVNRVVKAKEFEVINKSDIKVKNTQDKNTLNRDIRVFSINRENLSKDWTFDKENGTLLDIIRNMEYFRGYTISQFYDWVLGDASEYYYKTIDENVRVKKYKIYNIKRKFEETVKEVKINTSCRRWARFKIKYENHNINSRNNASMALLERWHKGEENGEFKMVLIES